MGMPIGTVENPIIQEVKMHCNFTPMASGTICVISRAITIHSTHMWLNTVDSVVTLSLVVEVLA